jgi:stalled ribosome rescue protein Dom34
MVRVITSIDDSEEEAKKVSELEKHIVNSNNMVVIGDREIQEALEAKVVKEIYYFSDDAIDDNLINDLRRIGGIIIRVDMKNDSNQQIRDRYGNQIGLLHYPINFSDQSSL